MEKVYIVLLRYTGQFTDELHILGVTKNKKSADRILNEIAEDEIKNSWIADYKTSELDRFIRCDSLFKAIKDDEITEIWVEEREIEE